MRRGVGADVAERGLGTMADLLGMLFFFVFLSFAVYPYM